VAGPWKKARKSASPADRGFWVGFIIFLLALCLPAAYVASRISRRPGVPSPTLTPDEERLLDYLRQNWTEEAGFSKALGIGLASGIAVATSGYVTRALRHREISRGA
jgi:hypothetical protein